MEALGVNSKGVAHSSTGLPAMEGRARFEHLISAAREADVLTIGIGDNGNEIGFGLIAEEVRSIKPFGRECRCPCGGGIATVNACDILITVAVSNWGGVRAFGWTGSCTWHARSYPRWRDRNPYD